MHEVPIADSLGDCEQLVRVVAAQHRIEEHAVGNEIHAVHGICITAVHLQIQRHREIRLRSGLGTHCLAHQTMCQIQVMGGAERERAGAQARRMLGAAVAQVRRAPRFVERGVGVHTVAKALGHNAGILRHAERGLTVQPAIPVRILIQILRQIPMVERHNRVDAVFEQLVDNALVEIEALLVRLAVRGGNDARHANREPVCVHAEIAHELEIVLPAVVEIVGLVSGVAIQHAARGVREHIPDRRRAAVFVHRAFDLVGGSRGAELEALRERHRHC